MVLCRVSLSVLFLGIFRYKELPPISRLYLTGAFITTGACAVEIISPFSLYFEWGLIVQQGEIWRLVTSYLFFGLFSVDFLFHMYFLVRYSRMLEEGDFRGRTANYLLMLIFGCCAISAVATFVNVHFLGSALTFMMTYVWGRRNEDVRVCLTACGVVHGQLSAFACSPFDKITDGNVWVLGVSGAIFALGYAGV